MNIVCRRFGCSMLGKFAQRNLAFACAMLGKKYVFVSFKCWFDGDESTMVRSKKITFKQIQVYNLEIHGYAMLYLSPSPTLKHPNPKTPPLK